MENKIYVEMTIDELNAFKEFKDNDISTQTIVTLLMNRCASLKKETGTKAISRRNYISSFGTIYLDDDSQLYFCYTREGNINEH